MTIDSLGGNITENGARYTASAVIYGCVLAFGLPLNTVSLWVLLRHHGLKSSCNVIMSHLALSDLLLVLSLPLRVYFYATQTWPFNTEVCCTATLLFRNNILSSALFITLISLDRLLAVVYPLRSRHLRTASNAWKACLSVWLLIVVTSIPMGISFTKQMKECNASVCFENIKCEVDTMLPRYLVPVLLFTLLVVNLVSTAMVSWTLRKHLSSAALVNNKMNVMVIFAMNLLMFAIFFLPFSIILLVWGSNTTLKIATCLASINCCLDPLLYYFSLDAFWRKKEEGSDQEPTHELGTLDATKLVSLVDSKG